MRPTPGGWQNLAKWPTPAEAAAAKGAYTYRRDFGGATAPRAGRVRKGAALVTGRSTK
jgi:hypothetical protein